jgi:hypothetical protein
MFARKERRMLNLDDPLWKETSHCYGSGDNIPPFIRKIEKSKSLPNSFWDELSNILCHQCTLGSASYAAFPHLVRIAREKQGTQISLKCLDLASLILGLALAPENKLPKLDRKLLLPFRDAMKLGRSLVSELYLSVAPKSRRDSIHFLAISAAFMGYGDVSLMLDDMSDGTIYCDECEHEIDMTTKYTI